MTAPTLPPAAWADLLAAQLAEADTNLIQAIQEAEAYRTALLQAITLLAEANQALHAARRRSEAA